VPQSSTSLTPLLLTPPPPQVEYEARLALSVTPGPAEWVVIPQFFLLVNGGRGFNITVDPTQLPEVRGAAPGFPLMTPEATGRALEAEADQLLEDLVRQFSDATTLSHTTPSAMTHPPPLLSDPLSPSLCTRACTTPALWLTMWSVPRLVRCSRCPSR
jgi:hypothetical protein